MLPQFGQSGSKGTFKNGFEDGPWESYYRDGRVMEKGIYKDGAKCGNWEERGDSYVTLTIRLLLDSTWSAVLEQSPLIYDPCPPDLEGAV